MKEKDYRQADRNGNLKKTTLRSPRKQSKRNCQKLKKEKRTRPEGPIPKKTGDLRKENTDNEGEAIKGLTPRNLPRTRGQFPDRKSSPKLSTR